MSDTCHALMHPFYGLHLHLFFIKLSAAFYRSHLSSKIQAAFVEVKFLIFQFIPPFTVLSFQFIPEV